MALDDDGVTIFDFVTETVTFTDVLPAISLVKTASPLTLPEPGGTFTFSVTVSNDSVEPVVLDSLLDDIYGDITVVAGDISATDCAVGGSIAVDDSYSCSFEAAFTGNAFDAQTDIVSAVASDDEGNAATASDDATVSLTNVASSLSLVKTASPSSVPEPGAEVVFSVSLENTSLVDTVTISALIDDIHGDISAIAGDISATDCAVPFDLAPAATYDCAFTALVDGNAGTVETDTVTASGLDDDGFDVSASDDADVTITDVLPAISLVKTASPLTLPEPGGTFTFSVTVCQRQRRAGRPRLAARRHLRRHHRRGRRHQRHRLRDRRQHRGRRQLQLHLRGGLHRQRLRQPDRHRQRGRLR